VKSKGKGKGAKQPTNTVSRQNSVTHNSRHLKAVAKVCQKIGRRDLQANALARYSKVHAALLNINKPVAAKASLRGKRGLGVAPGVFRVRLDISEKAKRIHKKHEAVRSSPFFSRHCPLFFGFSRILSACTCVLPNCSDRHSCKSFPAILLFHLGCR
jgi:hypothetical protein